MNDKEFVGILEEKVKCGKMRSPFSRTTAVSTVETLSQPIGALLREWQRSQKYQDARGVPKPLRQSGRGPSLRALIRSSGLGNNLSDVVEFLLNRKLIKRLPDGRYSLVSTFVPIDRLDDIALQHGARGLDAFVATLWYNLNTRNSTKLLPEKRAETAYLPRRLHKEFVLFSQRQLTAVANTIDDWLESKARTRKPGEKCFAAGTTVVSFSDSPEFMLPKRQKSVSEAVRKRNSMRKGTLHAR